MTIAKSNTPTACYATKWDCDKNKKSFLTIEWISVDTLIHVIYQREVGGGGGGRPNYSALFPQSLTFFTFS